MKKQDKPKVALKVTKVVAKPVAKMPAKVAVKTTKTVVKPTTSKPVKKTNLQKYAEQLKIVKETRAAVGNNDKKKLSEMRFDKPYNSNDMTKDYLEAQRLRKKAGLGVVESAKLMFPQVGQKLRSTVKSMFGSDIKKK